MIFSKSKYFSKTSLWLYGFCFYKPAFLNWRKKHIGAFNYLFFSRININKSALVNNFIN